MRVIFQKEDYRIIEEPDDSYNMDDLVGDTFNVVSGIDWRIIAEKKAEFIRFVEEEGVYGYILEKWNPSIDKGWEHVDSCYGFVGQYQEQDEKFNHHIVAEMKQTIEKQHSAVSSHNKEKKMKKVTKKKAAKKPAKKKAPAKKVSKRKAPAKKKATKKTKKVVKKVAKKKIAKKVAKKKAPAKKKEAKKAKE